MSNEEPPTVALQKLKDQLSCPVCLENFADPKILPCFHSFCCACLKRLASSNDTEDNFQCPICNSLCSVPDKGMDSLPPSFYINNLMEVYALMKQHTLGEQHGRPYCDNCQKTNKAAERYCKDCDKYLCSDCCRLHDNWKPNAGHRVLALNEMRLYETCKNVHVYETVSPKSFDRENYYDEIIPGAKFRVIAVYDFHATRKGDLSFERGQKLTVLDDCGATSWWKARNDEGQEGFVPNNYILKLPTMIQFFFPKLTRERAESILVSEGNQGSFFIRMSSRTDIMHTLSLYNEGEVKHYQILQDEQKLFYLSENHRFSTLMELVEYHMVNLEGLPTRLTYPPLNPPLHEIPNQDSCQATAGLNSPDVKHYDLPTSPSVPSIRPKRRAPDPPKSAKRLSAINLPVKKPPMNSSENRLRSLSDLSVKQDPKASDQAGTLKKRRSPPPIPPQQSKVCSHPALKKASSCPPPESRQFDHPGRL